MNLQSFKNKNGVIILVSVVAIILIYSIDLFKLNYRSTGWEPFGKTSVEVSHIQYFIADTPNTIGYKGPNGETVSCELTVAYVETDTQETHRCCDTGKKISCLAGNFSRDIPPVDENCTNKLQSTFGIPSSLAGAKEYQTYANCPSGSEITVVQLDSNGDILWKSIDVNKIYVWNGVLKFVLGPLLLALIGWIVFTTLRGKKNEPVRRF